MVTLELCYHRVTIVNVRGPLWSMGKILWRLMKENHIDVKVKEFLKSRLYIHSCFLGFFLHQNLNSCKIVSQKHPITSGKSWQISRICFKAGNTHLSFFNSSTNLVIQVIFWASLSYNIQSNLKILIFFYQVHIYWCKLC